jgi:hypothetical protein
MRFPVLVEKVSGGCSTATWSFSAALGFRRRVPEGITPHLGSQWWCLTRQTLSAILEDPRGESTTAISPRSGSPTKAITRRWCATIRTNIESRSLTLSKFDFQGKPHVFYDDHLQLLRRSDCFVARKIWPRRIGSMHLPERRASGDRGRTRTGQDRPDLFQGAGTADAGAAGSLHAQPLPQPGLGKRQDQRALFGVRGVQRPVRGFRGLAVAPAGTRVHGNSSPRAGCGSRAMRTFMPAAVSRRRPARLQPRGFPDQPDLEHAGRASGFSSARRTTSGSRAFMANDDNAQISVITGAWAVPLFSSNRNFSHIRSEAARLHLDGFAQFLQSLRNQGMNPFLVGDFPQEGYGADPRPTDQTRPYLVR